jgi:hypothetical protein
VADEVRFWAVVLGDEADAFDAIWRPASTHSDGGTFPETVRYVYELARNPR